MPRASDDTDRSSSSTVSRSPFIATIDSWPTMMASSRASTCGGGNSILFSFSLQESKRLREHLTCLRAFLGWSEVSGNDDPFGGLYQRLITPLRLSWRPLHKLIISLENLFYGVDANASRGKPSYTDKF